MIEDLVMRAYVVCMGIVLTCLALGFGGTMMIKSLREREYLFTLLSFAMVCLSPMGIIFILMGLGLFG